MTQDTQPEGPIYVVGDRVYFCPSLKRMPHGTVIGAGMVVVTEIVDHGTSDPSRDRWTYIVREDGLSATGKARTQGAAEEELHFWSQH